MKKKLKCKNKQVSGEPPTQNQSKDKHVSQRCSKENTTNAKTATQYEYTKRAGTSGISGQLYETKLLTLLLIRALNDTDISTFSLETNLADIGDLDDVVFRYNLQEKEKSSAFFVQAKHRDNPENDKVTLHKILSEDSDFSLFRYLDSYIKIKYKFSPNNSNPVFRGNFKDVDCNFIIYTPAVENVCAKKVIVENTLSKEHLMEANKTGKTFHIDYNMLSKENIDTLMKTIRITRIKLLAKRFVKLVRRDNCINMMTDDLMKTYHVFIAENVILLSDPISPKDPFATFEFRENFINSDNYMLTILRDSIYEESVRFYGETDKDKTNKLLATEDIIKVIKLLPNKVPREFGNREFNVKGVAKRERRLIYLSTRLKRLIEHANSSTNIARVDDNMLGLDVNSVFMEGDIKTCKIGGLVGNLLVLDVKLNMLKLNPKYKNLSEDAISVYKTLKEATKLNDQCLMKYRFDINVHCFPRLTLYKEEHDIDLLKHFLGNLTFYTNQARENDIEEIIKDEIDKLYNTQDDLIFRIKRDAIFLMAHDKIQQWWKKKVTAPDLNKDCKFFMEARNEIVSNPLLSILNELYTKQINKISIQFNAIATQTLHFVNDTEENLIDIISTDEITLTSLKLLQYFKNNCSRPRYIFVDLDFVLKEDYFQLFIGELKEMNADNLIIISKERNDINYLNEKLKSVFNVVKKSVIIITHNLLANKIMLTNPDKFRHEHDKRNLLSDLDFEHPNTEELLNEKIVFQGEEVPLNVLVKKEMYTFVNLDILYKVIYGEKICIGRILTKPTYSEIKSYYEEQDTWRCISLKIDKLKKESFNIIESEEIENIEDNKDIILISNVEEKFKNLFEKYKHSFNIHWFIPENNTYIWRQTNGSVKNISYYVERRFDSSYKEEIKTDIDNNQEVIIIGAEAGMGKSTFLDVLATKLKAKYPFLWIANINLLDYSDEFNRWQEDEIDIETEADLLLCRALCMQPFMKKESQTTLYKNVKVISNNFVELVSTEQRTKVCLKNNCENFNDVLVQFELELFNYYYSKGQVIVLFDGFDEICPSYNNEVIHLIKILKRRIKSIYITTRPYNFILNQLEENLGTFSYNLQLWSIPKQNSFLTKYFIKKLAIDIKDIKNVERLKLCCDNFLKNIHLSISDNKQNNKFTEIPLHIYMIAEIFQQSFINYYKTGIQKLSFTYKKEIMNLNLITLYERFADHKFKILYGEKYPPHSAKTIDRQRYENDRKDFLNYHKNIAAYTLFDNNFKELFSDEDKIRLDNLIERAKIGNEKTGIINEIVGNEPKFVHFTYAEYFATEFLCDKLLNISCTETIWIYLVQKVLTDNGNEGIRKFFNSKLVTKNSNLQNYSDTFYSNKHVTAILDQMFKQTNEPYNDTSLYIAIEESLENISTFLLTSMKTALNEDHNNNLDKFIKIIIHRSPKSCVFCAAVKKELKNVIGAIIGSVKDLNKNKLMDIFQCEDDPNNPFIIALFRTDMDVENNVEIIDFMLKSISDNNVVFQLFARPYPPVNAIQFLINREENWIQMILKHLKKFKRQQLWKLFSARDSLGRTPAHYADSANDIQFYSIMKSLLNNEQFNKICSTEDIFGKTPMRSPIMQLLHDVGAALEEVNPFPEMTIDDFLRNIVGKK